MIVTVTVNPSVDISVEVETLRIGEVNRTRSTHREPGGKGINVSHALALNGVRTVALFPADEPTGHWIENSLARDGVSTITAMMSQDVRHNVSIADAQGSTTNLNDDGPELSEAESDTLAAEVIAVLDTRPDWLVVAGSLPPGMTSDYYVRLGELAQERGVRFACDSSGMALRRVAEAGVAHFMKPNLVELQGISDRQLTCVNDVTNICRQFLFPSAEIIVSLGARGALLVTEDETVWAIHEDVPVASTVGAGDSCVAGYLEADLRALRNHFDPREARDERLRTAVAWGAAAVQLPGTALPGPDVITPDRVHLVRDPDPMIRVEDLTL